MWKPNKKTLLIITIILGTIAGILFQLVKWDDVFSGKNLLKELHLPSLFLALGFYYLYMYFQKLKSDTK